MPTERITMRRVREMLKLKQEGDLSTQEVARRTGVARSTFTFRDSFRSLAIALIGLPAACSRRVRTKVSTTNIPISTAATKLSSQA